MKALHDLVFLLIFRDSGYFSLYSFRVQPCWPFGNSLELLLWPVFLLPRLLTQSFCTHFHSSQWRNMCVHKHIHTHTIHHLTSTGSFFWLRVKITSYRKCSLCFLRLDISSWGVLYFSPITIEIFAYYKMCLSHSDVSSISTVCVLFFCFLANKAQCALHKYLLNEEMTELIPQLIPLISPSLYPTGYTCFSILIPHL